VPDVRLDNQRPAQFVFSQHVEKKLEEIRQNKQHEPLEAAE
jgi:hypothetical protein